MSTPEQEMANLNLGGYQNLTPRQAGQQRRRQREAQGRIQQEQTLQAQRGANIRPIATPPLPAELPPERTSESTQLKYALRDLASMPALYASAVDALRYPPKFDVDRASEEQDPQGSFYAFQMKKYETVRIYYARPDSQTASVTCTCQPCRNSGLCDHIFQLQDLLNAELGNGRYSNSVLGLTRVAIETRLQDLSPQIGNKIHSLPDAINFRGEIDSESEADLEDSRDRDLQDMLSVLDEYRLPAEFTDDFFEDIPSFTGSMSKMVVPGNSLATLWGLAKYDTTLAIRLKNAITKELCERDFITKLRKRANDAFDAFEAYAHTGPNLHAQAVNNTAKTLRRVVASLRTYLNVRAPTGLACHRAAAELVVRILQRAGSQWDCDIYDPRPSWLMEHTATTRAPSSSEERNLFANLLISGSRQGSNGAFALDVLSDGRLRTMLSQPQRDVLEDLHTRLVRRYSNDSTGSRSPRTTAARQFTLELRTLLDTVDDRDVPGVVDPVSSPPPRSAARRRPSSLEESESRRRRVQ